MSSNAYNRKVIAKALKLTEKRVKQLTEEGVLEEVSTGHYGLIESLHAYIDYIQNKNPTSDYNKEKARLTKAKAEKEEAEVAVMKGELHKASDIEFVVSTMLVNFRAKMLTVPNKAMIEIKNAKSDNDILQIIKKYVVEALDELSEFNIDKYNDVDGDDYD